MFIPCLHRGRIKDSILQGRLASQKYPRRAIGLYITGHAWHKVRSPWIELCQPRTVVFADIILFRYE